MYKLCQDIPNIGSAKSIIRVEDGACIPLDPDNTDYQKYLAWLAEGNTPLPPDAPTEETK